MSMKRNYKSKITLKRKLQKLLKNKNECTFATEMKYKSYRRLFVSKKRKLKN